MFVGDKVVIGFQTGKIVDIAKDGEVKVKLDGSSDPGMWYPPTAIGSDEPDFRE